MAHILGLGDNTIDTYVDADLQYPGGNAINVAVLAARIGANAAYLGCFGDDEGGELLKNTLVSEGIDISRTRVRNGENARAFLRHVAGDRQFIRSGRGVRADYRWEEDDFAYIATFDHVHFSIYGALEDVLPRIAQSARSLSFDASHKWTMDYLRDILPHVRFPFLSGAGLSHAQAQAVAEECLALGPETVVVTLGSGGAIGVSSEGVVFQPAFPVTVVDTLGAGDGFIAGFLVARLSGFPIKDAMARGAEIAAQVCGWHGCFGHGAPWKAD